MKAFNSPPVPIISQEAAQAFLSDPANYQQLMPDDLVHFEVKPNGFSFQLKGLPSIDLNQIEAGKPRFKNAGGNIDFELLAIAEKDAVKFAVEGNFSGMIAMMVKKPLQNLLNGMAEQLKKQNL